MHRKWTSYIGTALYIACTVMLLAPELGRASDLDEVTGRVTEKSTGIPVSGALVVLLRQFDYDPRITFPNFYRSICYSYSSVRTDEEGRFKYKSLHNPELNELAKKRGTFPTETVAAAVIKNGLMMPVTVQREGDRESLKMILMGGSTSGPSQKHYEISALMQPMKLSSRMRLEYYNKILHIFETCRSGKYLADVASEMFMAALAHAETPEDVMNAYGIGVSAARYAFPEAGLSSYKVPLHMRHALVEHYLNGKMLQYITYRAVRKGIWGKDEELLGELEQTILDEKLFDPTVTDGSDIRLAYPSYIGSSEELLKSAVRSGRIRIINALLKRGCGLNENNLRTSLAWVIRNNRMDILETLLKHGIEIPKEEPNPFSILNIVYNQNNVKALDILLKYQPWLAGQLEKHFYQSASLSKSKSKSARNMSDEMLMALFRNGMSPDAADGTRENGARLAMADGNVTELKWFLARGARIGYIPPNKSGGHSAHALVLAARSGKVEMAKFVVENIGSVSDKVAKNSLDAAIKTGSVAIVKLYLERLPLPSPDKRELSDAAVNSNPEIMAILEENGFRPSSKYIAAKLQELGRKGDIDGARKWLEKYQIDGGVYKSKYGPQYFIDDAVLARNLDLLKLYAAYNLKASPDKMVEKYSKVHMGVYALSNADFEIFEFLLTSGIININTKDSRGTGWLNYVVDTGLTNEALANEAREQQRKKVADKERLSAKQDGKRKATGAMQATAISFPVGYRGMFTSDMRRQRIKLVDYILSRGANINEQDKEFGFTPLMRAVYIGDLEMARHLHLSGKARLDQKNKKGETALDIARSRNLKNMITWLENPASPISLAIQDIPPGRDPRQVLNTALNDQNYAMVNALAGKLSGNMKRPIYSSLQPLTPEKVTTLLKAGFRLTEIYPVYWIGEDKIHRVMRDASEFGKADVVAVFLDAGLVDPGLLFSAVRLQNSELVRLVLETGTFSRPAMTLPPLYLAITDKANLEVIELLISHGANTQVRDAQGRTMPELARKLGREDIAELIEKTGLPSAGKSFRNRH